MDGKNKSNSSSNRLDMNQFIVLLCGSVRNEKHFKSMNKLFKNDNVSLVGTGKNKETALFSKTTKP